MLYIFLPAYCLTVLVKKKLPHPDLTLSGNVNPKLGEMQNNADRPERLSLYFLFLVFPAWRSFSDDSTCRVESVTLAHTGCKWGELIGGEEQRTNARECGKMIVAPAKYKLVWKKCKTSTNKIRKEKNKCLNASQRKAAKICGKNNDSHPELQR